MRIDLVAGTWLTLGTAMLGVGPARADGLKDEESIALSAKQLAGLQALTPDGVAAGVTIVDDDLETVATITTERALRNKGSFTDRVRSDNFLRALIDKRSGVVRYQLYEAVTYGGPFRNFTNANYATPAGPVSTTLMLLGHDVSDCVGSLCVNRDAVAFDVDEPVLQAIAKQYGGGGPGLWVFRFKGQAGIDWNDRMATAEVAGLLKAVDAYRERRGGAGR